MNKQGIIYDSPPKAYMLVSDIHGFPFTLHAKILAPVCVTGGKPLSLLGSMVFFLQLLAVLIIAIQSIDKMIEGFIVMF